MMVAKQIPERNVCQDGKATSVPKSFRTRAYFHHPITVMKSGIRSAVEITIGPFEQAVAIQTTRSTGPYAMAHRIFGQMLDGVAGAAAGQLGLGMTATVPHFGHVAQPKVSGFHVDCRLRNVMLQIWISNF